MILGAYGNNEHSFYNFTSDRISYYNLDFCKQLAMNIFIMSDNYYFMCQNTSNLDYFVVVIDPYNALKYTFRINLTSIKNLVLSAKIE